MNEKDFGKHYLEFYPSFPNELNTSFVIVDGSFTAQQLRNIADELDRQENLLKEEEQGFDHNDLLNEYAYK